MSQSFETQFEVDREVPLVRIIREFAADPALVFAAHADGAQYAKWIGPANSDVTIDHWECRIGGSYRWAVVREDFEARFFGSFHDVRTNELIVQTFTFEGMRGEVALEKLRFEPNGKGHTLLTTTSLVDSFADRDAFVASGMVSGVTDGYLALDKILAS